MSGLNSDYDNQYYILASSAVFYYDFALTVLQEIKYLWSSKMNKMNVLVLALRYITALGYIPVLMLTFLQAIANNFERIETWFGFIIAVPGILGVVCQTLTSVFLIIRLYAIYDKRRWILFVTVPFALLNIVLSSLTIGATQAGLNGNFKNTGAPNIFTNVSCFVVPLEDSLGLFKWSYLAVILFDALVFILAAIKTRRMYLSTRWHGSRPSIASILLRDGTILYATLAISNITNFVMFMLFIGGLDISIDFGNITFIVSSGINNEMTHALSVILVSRMVFNLREVGTEIYEGTEEWKSRVASELSAMFPTAVNNTGNRRRQGGPQLEDEFGMDSFDI